MNRALIIATNEITHVDAYILTPEGVQPHFNILLSDVKTHLGEGSASYFCHTEWVSFVDVTLPNVKPALLRSVVPNLVEEQLAESLENVHCAISSMHHPNQETAVAVIERASLEAITQAFKTANIYLEGVYPDCYLLPVPEKGWTCWAHEEYVTIREDRDHGFELYESEVDEWFEEMGAPEEITDVSSDQMIDWVEAYFEGKGCTPINLLQGDFAPRARKKDAHFLKKSLYALGSAVAFYFIYLVAAGAILSHRFEKLQAQTLALYQQVVPGATQATSPRVVLSRELQKTGQMDERFFQLLVALSEGVARSAEVEVMHLQFTGDRITATVKTNDFSTIDAWPLVFDHSKVVFKRESAEQKEGQVIARVQLETKP